MDDVRDFGLLGIMLGLGADCDVEAGVILAGTARRTPSGLLTCIFSKED